MTTETVEGYDLPADLGDAELAYQDLVFEVQHIQEQLGNRNHMNGDGQRVDGVAYWEWRHRAQGALRHRLDELRALKAHIKELRRTTSTREGPSPFPIIDALVLAHREGRDTSEHVAALSSIWHSREERA